MKSYPLDLSALAYPMMRTRKTQSNFHFSAELTETVDPDILKQSLTETLARYPVFKTRIAPSFFWHVFKQNDAPLLIKENTLPPLMPLKDTNGYPFRLAYFENEIVLEVFHAVTDGNVGALFMTDLLSRYAEIKQGTQTSLLSDRRLIWEDAFLRYGRKKRLRDISLKNYNGESVYALGKKGKYRPYPELLCQEIALSDLKAAAKRFDATVTEYVAACYVLAVLGKEPLPLKKPLCLFIPVDLRRFFPSKTMQNFVCFERIYLEKGESNLSFPHVLRVIKEQFAAKITKENMQDHVDDVRRCFTLPVLKYVPLFIKQPCFRLAKALMNKVRQTAIFSNVGAFCLPESATSVVKNVKFFLNVGKNAPLNFALSTYNDVCNVTVTNGLEGDDIPARFFNLLKTFISQNN